MEFKQMTRNKYYDELEQVDEQFDVRNKIDGIIRQWIYLQRICGMWACVAQHGGRFRWMLIIVEYNLVIVMLWLH